MPKFNLEHGQTRASGGNYPVVFRPMTPKKSIMLGGRNGEEAVNFKIDALGNVDVSHNHDSGTRCLPDECYVADFYALGYPVYIGEGPVECPRIHVKHDCWCQSLGDDQIKDREADGKRHQVLCVKYSLPELIKAHPALLYPRVNLEEHDPAYKAIQPD